MAFRVAFRSSCLSAPARSPLARTYLTSTLKGAANLQYTRPATSTFRPFVLMTQRTFVGSSLRLSTPSSSPEVKKEVKQFTKADMEEAAAKAAQSSAKDVADSKKQGLIKEFMAVFREYGVLAIAYHYAVYGTTFSTFYLAVKFGLDVPSLVKSLPESMQGEWLQKALPTAGTLGLAFILQKIISPLRIILTITTTPMLARYLSKYPIMKRVFKLEKAEANRLKRESEKAAENMEKK